MALPSVTVVGAGQVGATVAHLLLLQELADVTLIDVVDGLAAGKALDLLQAAAIDGRAVRAAGTTDYAALAGSRLVVVTAGLARKPGMSRDDLLAANAGIVGPIADAVARHAPEAVVIVVTNPLDVMTALVLKRTGFPRQRVIGMAGVLDSGRLRAFLSQQTKAAPAAIQAMVLGSHGDLMVPLKSSITINGAPATATMPPAELDRLLARTRDGGAEIVSLLKTSSAFYAPASGVAQMARAVLRPVTPPSQSSGGVRDYSPGNRSAISQGDERRVLPAAVWLEGEYGLRDVCIGVPVELAAKGVARIVEMPLTDDERRALHQAAEQVRQGIAQVLGAKSPSRV